MTKNDHILTETSKSVEKVLKKVSKKDDILAKTAKKCQKSASKMSVFDLKTSKNN